MEKLQLISPTMEYKNQVMDYKKEFLENGETLDGTGMLAHVETYEEWLQSVKDNQKEESVWDGLVPATTFLGVKGDELIGFVDIRHYLNEFLENIGGHIGYSVKRSQRQKGYGTEILGLALEECKKIGLQKILITCHKENIPSEKIILHYNVFKKESPDQRGIKKFWITI
ncbi:MAG: GNAT family N-acetyltransferase [Tissierellia bacterium]|nr:GNAT family N-acetyltransferase [Tissierellia bacterium]